MGPAWVRLLRPEEIPLYAEQFLPLLGKIEDIDCGRWTIEQCFDDIKIGNLLVWLCGENETILAVITTRICKAKIQYLIIEDIAGEEINKWVDLAHDSIERLARHLNCQQIVTGGRPGWQKYFRKFGFTLSRVEGFKNLEPL